MLSASRESKSGGDKANAETLTFNAATRFWRGRECLSLDDMIRQGVWPASGKKSFDGQSVMLGLTWQPTPNGVFLRYHVSDIWLDDAAMQRAAKNQTEAHKDLIRTRWMPGWIDAIDYGKFGRAVVTATLFGGMDESLYADFTKGAPAVMNSVENTLRHTHGAYGPTHMASAGTIFEIKKSEGAAPLGSSGIHIRFETDLIIEGIRPGRVIRVRPRSWPQVNLPREEYLNESIEERFPSPAIFPRY
jgi:hypothetical protein